MDVEMVDAEHVDANGADVDDDPIVHEVDVYLAKGLADHLYLFQYPLRAPSVHYNAAGPVLDARIKPRQHKIEIDLPIDVHSANYDVNKGHEIAANAGAVSESAEGEEEDRKPGEKMFPSGTMDKRVLTSSLVTARTHYAIGVLRENELHITPINAMVQMRPSFAYLDRADATKKEVANAEAAAAARAGQPMAFAGATDDEGTDEEEEAKAVTVTFTRKENERTIAARKRSHAYLQQQSAAEAWQPLRYYPADSEESNTALDRMFYNGAAAEEGALASAAAGLTLQAPREFLESLNPPPEDSGPSAPVSLPSHLVSLDNLHRMPVEDQLRTLMLSAHVAHFKHVLQHAAPRTPPAAALAALERVAVLVRGCWVVRSEIVYPAKSTSPVTGVPATLLTRARDYMLYLLHTDGVVGRKEFAAAVKLPVEDVKAMLSAVARLRTGRGWELKLDADTDFSRQYPDVAAKQQQMWDQRKASILQILKPPAVKKEDAPPPDTKGKAPAEPPVAESGFSSAVAGDTLEAQLTNFVGDILRHYGVCSMGLFKRQLQIRQAAGGENNLLARGVSDNALQAAIRGVGTEIVPEDARPSVFVLTSTGSAAVDKPRQAVLELMRTRATVKKADVMAACKAATGEELSSHAYNRIMKELAVARGGQWSFKAGDGSMASAT